MKKVAIFTKGLLPNGATKSLIELLKKLDYKDICLDLYILNFVEIDNFFYKQIPSDVNIKKVNKYAFNAYSIKNIIMHPIHFFKAIFAKCKLKDYTPIIQFKYTAARYPIIDEKYDVAISYRHLDIDTFFVANNMIASKKAFFIHGVQDLGEKQIKLLAKIYRKYEKIFPVSQTAKHNIKKYFDFSDDQLEVIYSIVDGKMIKNLANEGNKLPQNNVLKLLTISRLSKEKGLDLLLKTCLLLKKRNINFQWYICGDGSLKDKIENDILKYDLYSNLVLFGNVDNPYGYLKSCDIYVQTSLLESYCLAINEAKILNKPIVCTNIPAANEQLVNYKTGILSNQTAEDLADKIEELQISVALREKLINNLSQNDYSHYDAPKQIKKFIFYN